MEYQKATRAGKAGYEEIVAGKVVAFWVQPSWLSMKSRGLGATYMQATAFFPQFSGFGIGKCKKA